MAVNNYGKVYRIVNTKNDHVRLYSKLVSAVFAYVGLRPVRRYWRPESEQEENPYRIQMANVEWKDVQAE